MGEQIRDLISIGILKLFWLPQRERSHFLRGFSTFPLLEKKA